MLDGDRLRASLPEGIDAFLYNPQWDELEKVRELHGRFLAAHGLRAADVPLLAFRRERDAGGGRVFSEDVGT